MGPWRFELGTTHCKVLCWFLRGQGHCSAVEPKSLLINSQRSLLAHVNPSPVPAGNTKDEYMSVPTSPLLTKGCVFLWTFSHFTMWLNRGVADLGSSPSQGTRVLFLRCRGTKPRPSYRHASARPLYHISSPSFLFFPLDLVLRGHQAAPGNFPCWSWDSGSHAFFTLDLCSMDPWPQGSQFHFDFVVSHFLERAVFPIYKL